ncbi:MAG: HAD family hydrolase [Jaaginema sp. PMC 1079.18]|nr:HAD family hydrolase [Jaaginema sp. PMC 1080.18]MEC4852031.1 HAD family hydrolase [Jaaginema sp. PMC 1079.18]MEC4868210.1 HAD family hydrolase [Jaaginema sp. PMC 1078.18]
MSAVSPDILALDFDGVLCNGLKEYAQSAWRAYRQVWPTDKLELDRVLRDRFYPLRPVIETGWEMPVLLRALILGKTDAEVLKNWSQISQTLVTTDNLDPKNLAHTLDTVRDEWIQTDLDGWLGLHEFYPGVLPKLHQALENPNLEVYIITTKEGRFVQQLLQQENVKIERDRIFGKEVKRPKTATLQQLLTQHPQAEIWFVEDMLKTLYKVRKQPDLASVRLFLANWGYNTESARQTALEDDTIQLITLEKFAGEFCDWLS